jgi:dienelactone hydrolase
MKQYEVSQRRRAMLGAALSLPLVPGVGFAQGASKAKKAKLEDVADFFKLPTIAAVTLAPGGKAAAGLREIKGRLNIVVVDLVTMKSLIITNFDDKDVTGVRWISPNRLVFSLFDRFRGSWNQLPEGTYAIDRDGGNFLMIAGLDDPRALPLGSHIIEPIKEDGEFRGEVLVSRRSMQAQGKFSSNVYRFNTYTRQAHLLTMGGPKDVVYWVMDRHHVPRAAVSQFQGKSKLLIRDAEDSPWRVIYEYGIEDVTESVYPLDFDAEGNLYVGAYGNTDYVGIYQIPFKASKYDPTPVVAIKGFDLNEGLIFDDKGNLLGVEYNADRAGVFWIDDGRRALQDGIDKALPDTINVLSVRGDTVLVHSYSDRDPGRYYLFDKSKKTLSELAVMHPWIDPQAMRPTTFYRYVARDGMSIPAQLTMPEGVSKPPLIVLHYGGPWVRPIEWAWDGRVQFLVSRGYAVFMPAPRASTGFGATLYKAGWKQWGLAMQDDVTDGVQDLIKRGLIDGNRVCLAGASYGGYLTMMGLAKEPQLFKCGINWVGVTDPRHMFDIAYTDFNEVDSGRYDLPLLVGDPDKDAEQFKKTSPVERAGEIMQPVLMAYGGLDRRVPLVNGERMLSALRQHHNDRVEWVVYSDEGHGFTRLDNNIDFWTRVENFLKKYL